MPPKNKFTREEITDASLAVVRRDGIGALTARAVAEELQSSTKVIFGLFRNMEELESEVVKAAYERYFRFLREDAEKGEYPPYKAVGMAYIRFAGEEKELFRLLFMHGGRPDGTFGEDTEFAVQMIMKANGFTREQAELLHLEMWVCVHGIAVMTATSYLKLDRDLVSRILTDVYQGVRKRMQEEGQ